MLNNIRHDYRTTASRIGAVFYEKTNRFWREKAIAVQEATGASQNFTLEPISHAS